MSHEFYQNPLVGRYASAEMSRLWGDERKFRLWRWLWVLLAEAEGELGLPISPHQVEELRSKIDDIDFAAAERYERQTRHDVMAHVKAFGDACPGARGVIHVGATSCYVTDNADLILMRESLQIVARRLAGVIGRLADFARQHARLPCLGFTHLQPAQPTTVGKRTCLWIYDLVADLEEVERRLDRLLARGAKGTTGTQASFLELFGGDHAKVKRLDELVSTRMGFSGSYPMIGQTYSRKVDDQILNTLSGIAASAHKAAVDLRLLQSMREIEEPFEDAQIGSSAMAYKRNPMRAERICGLARFVMSLAANTAQTAATQWMERTLDDSANRRLVLPQAFLAVDAVLRLYQNVASGLVVNPHVIAARLQAELPFMATENILMNATRGGQDRQQLHELIRRASQAAAARVKEGHPNDLVERLKKEDAFRGVDWDDVLEPAKFIGRAPEQVGEFLDQFVAPTLARQPTSDVAEADIQV